MTRHPRTLTLAVSILMLAVLAVATGPALARSRSRTAAVPRLAGDVSHAYYVLHRDGFKVSIARPFTLGHDEIAVTYWGNYDAPVTLYRQRLQGRADLE